MKLRYFYRTSRFSIFKLSDWISINGVLPVDSMLQQRCHNLVPITLTITNLDARNTLSGLSLSLLPTRLLASSSFSWVNQIQGVDVSRLEPRQSVSRTFLICFHERGQYQLVGHCQFPLKVGSDSERLKKDLWSPTLELNIV